MFRCKECGCEFDIKPDFCDCGNDTFDEITVQEELPKETELKINSEEKIKNKPEKIEKSISKSEQKSYYDYNYWNNIKRFFDPFSTLIFLICILLSVYIILYVGNPTEEIKSPVKPEQTITTNKNIPAIDTFWNDSLPAVQVKEEPVIIPEIKKIAEPVKKIEKKISSSITKKQEPQKQDKTKTTTVKSAVQNTKTTTAPATKPTQTKNTTVQQPTAQKQSQPVINKQELANYKINLRNRIASKIDFASVIGDGSCVVSFNLTSSGQLTNKKFLKQSDNFSLNDVVYNALMRTTSFNPPPSSYNGEVLKLTVKMNDGNFEVTLY